MTPFRAPLQDMRFVIHELLNAVPRLRAMPRFAEVDQDLVDQVLDEAGKFSEALIAPLNAPGDLEGCTLEGDRVRTPAGFKDAYKQYIESGWPALSCDPDYGGQGLPALLNNALYEMLNAANQAWTMYPGLSHGAYACLHAHGEPSLKACYLPPLVSGVWTGTMCLTEPQCGTDLGILRTRAEPSGQGDYLLSGTKIFISSGEHDLAENIVHLVLARLPDAPAGTKGISLFVVPKFLPGDTAAAVVGASSRHAGAQSVGERNTIACGRLEEKMGIHGNATCVMHLDGAHGWLVGEPNRGLQAMFVMMNAARLGVAVQGVGLTEAAYQQARAYARERRQMRSLTGIKDPDKPADTIVVHPDVRRMLLTQRVYAEGGRAFAAWLALLIDTMHAHPDAGERQDAADLVALLTPVAKAFLTDNAFESTNHAMQVFGGHGYIRETGVEQFVRDARINMIYEGTNTIQALDLLGRKVLGDMGAKLKKFGKLVSAFVEEEGVKPDMQAYVDPLADLAGKVEKLSIEIGMKAMANADEVGAAAVPYLRVVGHLVFAYLWARAARVALDKIGRQDASAEANDFYRAKLATAQFYFARMLPETAWHIATARAGAQTLMVPNENMF